MDDFLSRESSILGNEFSSSTQPDGGEIDFERAASAFPDISLDGSGDIPTASAPTFNTVASSGFSFDDFDSRDSVAPAVKVTGDDEIGNFESQFPDIVPQVRQLTSSHSHT
jgi:hypothetical protein